ncbi:hypothetical protein A1O3_06993 [Capronia epimyces CBS 606.96]|uniref:CHK kinase-like domain-containing protein n=1 Tax=Capronia epimyces CBS 606.96 TaxID=1182542 RepID=W9YEH3_9EURO|nr:uncharacterized protein A1O3_06993 [Capronia epimyces CBS 606.96]EXJ80709.1 hypothetical protein A1O3_06993 [Capronia epimyces CBS 606.96]
MDPDNSALHLHALQSLEASDRVLAKVNGGLDEVHRYDMITTDWLQEVLGASTPGAEITQWERTGGHKGMTSRHFLQVEWNEAGTTAELPTSIFIKATPDEGLLRETLSMLHMAELESNIYNVCGKDLADLIPRCYYAKAYPGGRFIILLEDLVQRNVEVHWMGDDCSVEYAKAVAVAQGKIHARFWNSPRFEGDGDMVWVRPRTRRFGEQWLQRQFTHVRATFLKSDLGKACPIYVRNLIENWEKNCTRCYEYWDRKPPTLVHGDSHLGNVLKFSDGSAGYYDWQCLFRGYGFRDLAYFLMSALTVEDVKAHEKDIFDLYLTTLEENGVTTVDPAEAWLDYNLLRLERLDSTMTSLSLAGGYGHARHALERQLQTLTYTTQEYDVASLLDSVVTTGSIQKA